MTREPREKFGILIYEEGLPPDSERVTTYCVRQGARGPLHRYDVVGAQALTVCNERARLVATGCAREDSKSETLNEKALCMALDQIAERASKDKQGCGVVAIANPRIKTRRTRVSDREDGFRGALTLEVEADGFKRK